MYKEQGRISSVPYLLSSLTLM